MVNLKKEVFSILEKIEDKGFQAYLVGGYVRDFLLGHESDDIDICTNATMDDLTFFNGEVTNYGSMHFNVGKFKVTITTFRIEWLYENHRHFSFSYTESLEKDLERRDFTINTICMNKKGEIIDLFHGRQDLEEKRIRMVGDPFFRLEEDPLRILRAIRFLVVLDFSLDQEVEESILKHKLLLKQVSKYRVREEMDKILSSPNYQKGLDIIKRFQMESVLDIQFEEVFYTSELMGMWAQIAFSSDFPFTKEEKKHIVSLRDEKIAEVDNF